MNMAVKMTTPTVFAQLHRFVQKAGGVCMYMLLRRESYVVSIYSYLDID